MRPFDQVDVFSPQPLLGNPVAVVHDAEGMTSEQMQQFTRWTNLSEATFLLPPTDPAADYRVRIFTLSGELPFAGHPTLGTCHAWLKAGGQPLDRDRIVQECGAGLVSIREIDGQLAFKSPPPRRTGAVEPPILKRIAVVLGITEEEIIDSQWVDNGPGWVAVMLSSSEAVDALRPKARVEEPTMIGVVGAYPKGGELAYEVRALFSDDRGQLLEDPVTGSLNASLAQWLVTTGRFDPPYIASQGKALGRKGRPRISQDSAGELWIGGETHTVLSGQLMLEDQLAG